jgi:hypothetical protein
MTTQHEPTEKMIEHILDKHFGPGEWTDPAFAAVKEALAMQSAAPSEDAVERVINARVRKDIAP